MGKKGTDGRRTSGITPTQVMNELSQHGFVLVTIDPNQAKPPNASRQKGKATTAFRKNGTATQNQFRGQVRQQEAAAAEAQAKEAAERNQTGRKNGVRVTEHEVEDVVVRHHEIATSRTGKSIRMVRAQDRVEVLLPVDDHMTDNALKAIQQKTGVRLSHLQQLQHKNIL